MNYLKSVIPIIEANYKNFTSVEKNIANFFRNKQHSFLKSRRFLWKKRIVTWLFEGKQDIIGNKSIHQVYAFIKSKRKKRKNRKKKSEKKRNSQNAGE